ncbi:nicotinate-nucleotide adenylyltransferase [Bacteroides caecigallinarum]|uniref:nicotinate (nicotinamide) nucleotide adenylyltransferase n=1 Tax=Bacteroides caecigallinarum TaxID=1411144 RepID=UPI00195C4C30|nr:nicotinate (nicotinamide) nucleotide adenylyltransferase [Bacteroides caecigallinarum]MBM6865104.1 nicotinate-nucleotide adenylyltransferase [Bacteroides caecigallinarum]MBU3809126.1 nicotinate-nucleotide adenylyltransferase [Candidatus Phocaeicola faecipullorum]
MEKKKLRTGIFGGSFNPIHIGHLALANYLCENDYIDELWFLVSPQNPFKQNEKLLDDKTRLRMVNAAVRGYGRFYVSDFEFSLPKPSYTINTLNKLSETYTDRNFYLIIGADNWAAFDRWKSPEEIISKHHVLVYPRLGYDIPEMLPQNVRAVDSPLIEVSSTFIRESISQGKNVRYFLHPAVYEIIEKESLYR